METMRFFLLGNLGDPNDDSLCVLDNFIEGIAPHSWRVMRGAPVAPYLPKDPRIYMDDDHPGIKLSSFIGNTSGMIIGTTQLKEVFEAYCPQQVEYLPFTLYDHRKRVHSRDYFIINPLGTFDCLDTEASDILWDSEDPGTILRVREPVLNRDKLKDAPPLFRIENDPVSYVLRVDLAREIKNRKFTNIWWTELTLSGGE